MEQRVFTVSEVNQYMKQLVDQQPALNDLLIRGEISNYKVYPSGHHYFTLKDAGGALKCVLFKGNAMRLRFRPENGMQVVEADVPMAEMDDFATFIRQCTQGRGTFTFEFARYEDAPAQVAQKVIEESKAAQEGAGE